MPDKAMAILLLMAERPKEVCSREYLLDAVWGPHRDTYDRVLDNAIREIRRAFDDSARSSRYIETIPKKGYRLIAEVEWPAPPEDGDGDLAAYPGMAGGPDRGPPFGSLPEIRPAPRGAEPGGMPAAEMPLAGVGAADGSGAEPGTRASNRSTSSHGPRAASGPGDDPGAGVVGRREFSDGEGIGHGTGVVRTAGSAVDEQVAGGELDRQHGERRGSGGGSPAEELDHRSGPMVDGRGIPWRRERDHGPDEPHTKVESPAAEAPTTVGRPPTPTATTPTPPGRESLPPWIRDRRRPIAALALISLPAAFGAAHFISRTDPGPRLHFTATDNRTGDPAFDDLHLRVIDRLNRTQFCGGQHLEAGERSVWRARRIDSRLRLDVEDQIHLDLGWPETASDRPGAEPVQHTLSFDRHLGPARIAAGAAELYLAWVDQRQCEGLAGGPDGGDGARERARHCTSAARRAIEEHGLLRAEALLSRAVVLDPEPLETHLLLAATRLDLGEEGKALKGLSAARKTVPDPRHRRILELRIALLEGRFEDAKALLESSREVAEDGG
ncbi:MAG: winged helix-turn-helix domain-containing protein, partial [Holophagales bacterium]|nr:winged helix-turn-helix domain-containing protein [Holophagales bacterium]